MKTLELKLKKYVLIIDLPNIDVNSKPKIIQDSFGFWIYFKIKGHKPAKIEFPHTFFDYKNYKNYKFLCKGSELTEEIASELVEEHYMSGVRSYEIYNDYRYNDARWLDNAKESFISAVESKEKFWMENPIEKPINYDLWAKYGDYTQYGKVLTEKCLKWKEAEEKTFRNPLIFVKK